MEGGARRRTQARRGGKRRKTGCINCRSRHTKCDEMQPTCGRCKRLGLDCEVTDFIVTSNWCSKTSEKLVPSVQDEVIHPSSTWDVFNNPFSSFSNLPSPRIAFSTHEGSPLMNSEIAELVSEYRRGIGVWMDLFDHDLTYQRGVIRRAHSSPIIMQSICALTAKQLSIVRSEDLWGPVAASYYGESLRLLISAIADPTSCQEDALAATILLSSYELLASPGIDHRRHVSGALTLIKAQKSIATASKESYIASFWIYARLDVGMALINECPTMLPPDEWEVCWTEHNVDEDRLGNHMLWILAKVIALTFPVTDALSEVITSTARVNLMTEINTWFDNLPTSFRGVTYGTPSREGFINLWFSVPAAAAAMLLYHLANLLLSAEGVSSSTRQDDDSQMKIQIHAHAIGDICLSKLVDGALVQAVQPLYYAAKHIQGLVMKSRLWTLLQDIETRLGFHTSSRIAKLQRLAEGLCDT